MRQNSNFEKKFVFSFSYFLNFFPSVFLFFFFGKTTHKIIIFWPRKPRNKIIIDISEGQR